ncbi:APC family permease [Lactococcus paracarnosus]|uniref:APC family permease n=1 Tax=Pseudolactococcus paracarnosus TaxID=2749962 RepID=A0A7L4WF54_9LACT|nr:APC family permease [Lactococcus paracarnosus]SPC35427.1 Amino acid permease [Lactococcus piscium]MCJ1977634.1 APC family permease [Lactococcus paracarnosus]MCJ1983777.1 APC family permease [Lactococcus paracarnosus]MCJ1994921.1 APC family permease [Lactococcus paracarnosus]MCJ1999250.1 APC family permease [Lactococcus paracarnosus]
MKQEKTRRFGLLMSIAMIVGIVIGSGIFFKADDILIQTNGNVMMGCLVLLFGAIGIIFGGITISEWAKLTDDAGGLIVYAEKAFGRVFAFLLGWFQSTVYFPALVAIVAFVASNYTVALFPQLNFSGSGVWLVSLIYLLLIYVMNIMSSKLSEFFQTSSMFIKLIPLFLIAIFGLIFGDPSGLSSHAITLPVMMSSTGAIVAVAFSYDGWAIAPAIGHEIKNSKRNLPIALIISPLIILIVYVSYFVGISLLIGPKEIMQMGDLAFSAAAEKLFGPVGQKLMLITVIISVLGTLNGLVVANIRAPYFLALRKELPYSKKISHLHPRFNISLLSVMLSFAMVLVWLGIHFMSISFPSVRRFGIDISSIPIVIMYLFYGFLYIGIMIRAAKGLIKNKLVGFVCPLLALAGALLILYGGLTGSNGIIYLIVSMLILVSGLVLYYSMRVKRN